MKKEWAVRSRPFKSAEGVSNTELFYDLIFKVHGLIAGMVPAKNP